MMCSLKIHRYDACGIVKKTLYLYHNCLKFAKHRVSFEVSMNFGGFWEYRTRQSNSVSGCPIYSSKQVTQQRNAAVDFYEQKQSSLVTSASRLQ